jgi:cytochrome P450
MEATLILATIARKFRLRLAADHPVVPLASITLRPRHGVRVVLEERQQRQAASFFSGQQSAVAD